MYAPIGMYEAPRGVRLAKDCYSLVFVSLVNGWNAQGNATLLCTKTIFSILLYCLSVSVQLIVIAFLLLSASRTDVLDDNYFPNVTLKEATRVLNAHVASKSTAGMPSSFWADRGVLQQCAEQLHVRYNIFYYMVLVIWCSAMMSEYKSIVSWIWNLYGMKERIQDEKLIDEKTKGIQYLDLWMKYVIHGLVTLPRVALATVVTYAGIKFLIPQTHVTTTVLNFLCLRFVMSIDSLLLDGLSPNGMLTRLQETTLHTTSKKPKEDSLWDSGLGGFFYLATVLAVVFAITLLPYGDLMHFRDACHSFDAMWHIPGVIEMGFEGIVPKMP